MNWIRICVIHTRLPTVALTYPCYVLWSGPSEFLMNVSMQCADLLAELRLTADRSFFIHLHRAPAEAPPGAVSWAATDRPIRLQAIADDYQLSSTAVNDRYQLSL